MADSMDGPRVDEEEEDEERGTVDALSVFFVVGGIPSMIVFFVGLFLLVGSCDQGGTYFPA